MHGRIRRYTSPDEHAFFPKDLPPLVLPPIQYSEASLTEICPPTTTSQHSSRGAASPSMRLDVCLVLHKYTRKGGKVSE